MWLRVNECLINLDNVGLIERSGENITFHTNEKHFTTEFKTCEEAKEAFNKISEIINLVANKILDFSHDKFVDIDSLTFDELAKLKVREAKLRRDIEEALTF